MSGRTIYMVTAGEYSDYQVLAIYDNREAAEAHVLAHNGPEEKYHGYGAAAVDEAELFAEYTPREGARGAFKCTDSVLGRDHYIYWCDGIRPDEPLSGAVVRGDKNGVPSITGYGPTSEHAKRAWYEAKRGIHAGTIVVDRDGKLIVPLPEEA